MSSRFNDLNLQLRGNFLTKLVNALSMIANFFSLVYKKEHIL